MPNIRFRAIVATPILRAVLLAGVGAFTGGTAASGTLMTLPTVIADAPATSAAPTAGGGTAELKPLVTLTPDAPANPAPAAARAAAAPAAPQPGAAGVMALPALMPSSPPALQPENSRSELAPAMPGEPPVAGPALPSQPGYPLVTFTTPPAAAATPPGTVGSKGAAFSLQTPSGESVAWPAAAQSQPTLLLFWPSWCPYSRALQPYIQTIWEDYRDHGVAVWTINIEETRDPVAVMQERQLSFPLLLAGNPVADAYGVRLMPAVLLMDAEGRIVYKMDDKTTSPIEASKQIRGVLNGLLGAKAVPLPNEYPKPYDLHLLALQGLNLKLAPAPVPQSEWEPWVDSYLASLRPGEAVAEIAPLGPISSGKQAITIARDIWSGKYGAEQTLIQAPYRSYRVNNHWVVLASGDAGATARLGAGFIAVLEVDSGRVVRVAPQQ